MTEDIRDKAYITHDDMVQLNFIKASGPYLFRRHYRQGLRSHILEILDKNETRYETAGCGTDGIKWYPKAKPKKMFRIFRTKLTTLESALDEIQRVKIVERYLAPDFMATSSEIIVDYAGPQGRCPILCGIQTYEAGEILDPWSLLEGEALAADLYQRLQGDGSGPHQPPQRWQIKLRQTAAQFVKCIKTMITESGYIPDLAGVGNLIATPAAQIKLVDINNISQVNFDAHIHLDDRGYPVSDKSIEALYLLEEKMTDHPAGKDKSIYKYFLEADRRKTVKTCEENFYSKNKHNTGYPAL